MPPCCASFSRRGAKGVSGTRSWEHVETCVARLKSESSNLKQPIRKKFHNLEAKLTARFKVVENETCAPIFYTAAMNFPSTQPETSRRREPLSWDGKLLIFGFPALLILAATGQFFLGRGEPEKAINYPAPAAVPVPNGFDAYLAVEVAIKLDTPAVDPIDDSPKFAPTDPRLAAQKYSLANKTAWLRANSAGFALFRAAQKLLCRHPEINYSGGFGGFNYAAYRQLQQLARYKVIETNALVMRKNWNGAVSSALDAIQMGNDIAIGGATTAKSMSFLMQSVAREPLTAPIDPISGLSAAQARAAAKRLETILSRRATYAQNLETSRWASLREFEIFSQQRDWQSQLASNSGREPTWREKLGVLAGPRSQIFEDIDRAYDFNIADSKLPFSAPVTSFEPRNPLSQNFAWVNSSRPDEARELVTLNILMLRFALRAYQAENGRFPRQLSELSPRYLKKNPSILMLMVRPFIFCGRGKNTGFTASGRTEKMTAESRWKKNTPAAVARAAPT